MGRVGVGGVKPYITKAGLVAASFIVLFLLTMEHVKFHALNQRILPLVKKLHRNGTHYPSQPCPAENIKLKKLNKWLPKAGARRCGLWWIYLMGVHAGFGPHRRWKIWCPESLKAFVIEDDETGECHTLLGIQRATRTA